ncbi:hypothetical protein LSH36_963g00021 [Paralvinella palmiformis]|uniref:Late endosomal/lysosomal adaptor and MAPK and MTOR activator 4 n=1 Tax=Paralvinella palmiformis TaxID=53620 RepID=A0AAD9IY09_9ANNE|nr:hypothetical protein LSH36_963g00021 [Paralvinella palmiformis]
MMTQGIEQIPDSLGYLMLNEDGAVIASGGQLENGEKIANKLMHLIRIAIKMPTSDERASSFKKITVMWKTFMYVITFSNHRVFICKRQTNSPEPIAV